MYPGKFEDLIEAFRHLPGVGIKTAERYAFTALEWDEETLDAFIHALDALREEVQELEEAIGYKQGRAREMDEALDCMAVAARYWLGDHLPGGEK